MRKFMRSNFSAFILAFALIVCTCIPAFATTSLQYVYRSADSNGNVISQTRTANKVNQLISKSEVVLEDSKWYYPYSKTVEITSITVSGDAHLILSKGHTLTVKKGIHVLEGSSLTIYGQPDGDGTLIAGGRRYSGGTFVDEDGNSISGGAFVPTTDGGQAGIGGFNGDPHNAPITITIHGGNIQATGGGGGAGIGCAGAWPSSITIYGGTITAQGGTNSAGIGGGVAAVRPMINIYGGSITATGGQNGAGIGGGFDRNPVESANQPGTITIYGGTITATGGKHEHVSAYSDKSQRYAAGIGGGDNSIYYTVNIYGGNITASRYYYHNGYGIRGQITLSYRNAGDSIYATNYGGTVTVADGKTFIVDGTEINGTLEIVTEEETTSPTEVLVFDTCPAIDGKTLTPQSSYKVNIGTTGITASTAKAFTGETVTLSPAEGYTLTGITVDGAAITGNTFTMPAKDVTVTGTATPITYTITYNLDGGTVSTANPTTYTVETETFTLKNPTRSGYYFVGWSAFAGGVKSINLMILKGSTGDRTYIANWEQSPVALGWTDSYNADGTEERPYLISDSYGWDFLVNELQTKNYSNYSGKIFKLTDDITVTEMLGTNGKEFSGIFDGNGKTLTFDYENATALIIAPFKYVKGATIKDLTVAGTINSSRKDGGNKYIGGLIERVNEGETTIENCKFVGKLLATDSANAYGGGFVVHNSGTLTINGSLYAPAELEDGETEPSKEGTATFARNSTYGTSTITNSYYTRTLGTAQGEQIYTVTADYDITIELAGDSENVLTYDGTIYAGSGKTLILTISGGNTKYGYTFMGYKASAGTLTESGGKYSLTMPEGNVTISAEFAQLYSVTISEAITNGTITADKAQAIEDETITLTVAPATGYAVSVVKYNGTVINPVEGVYSFVMPTENVTLTAEFSVVNYEVGGLNDNLMTADKTTANYGDVVTLTPAEGYEAENLTVMAGDSVVNVTVNADGTYTFTMPAGAVTVNFTLKPITYHITYSGVDGAAFTAQNPTEYTIESESFTLNNPTKDGYTFTGWILDGGNDEPAITVTIATGTTGNLAYTANWQKNGFSPEDSETPEFAYHSLILSGQIGVIFYVYAPEGLASKDFCVYFDVSGDKSQNTQPVYAFETMTEDGKNFLCFNCYINSVQMADKIHAELHYKDTNASEQTITHDYTAKQYLTRIIGDTTQAADTRELGRAIMDFGSYVQPVLAKENGWVIGENHAAMTPANNYNDTDFTATDTATQTYAITNTRKNSSGIDDVKFALMLDSETTIILCLIPKSDYTGEVSAYVDSNKTDNMAVKYGDYYTVSIGNISAHELGKTHTVEITTQYPNVASDSFTVGISALSYVQGAIHNDDTDLKRAVTSLYRYYDATMKYRNNRPDTYGEGE